MDDDDVDDVGREAGGRSEDSGRCTAETLKTVARTPNSRRTCPVAAAVLEQSGVNTPPLLRSAPTMKSSRDPHPTSPRPRTTTPESASNRRSSQPAFHDVPAVHGQQAFSGRPLGLVART